MSIELVKEVISGIYYGKKFNELTDSEKLNCYDDVVDLFGKTKWNEACEAQLDLISKGFLDKKKINKVYKDSDKVVLQAIGETIKNYPQPEYNFN